MSADTNRVKSNNKGADAIDQAIASGIDFDGSPIPPVKLELYKQVMGLEANRQRSGVSNTMRSRIVRIGAKTYFSNRTKPKTCRSRFCSPQRQGNCFFYNK